MLVSLLHGQKLLSYRDPSAVANLQGGNQF